MFSKARVGIICGQNTVPKHCSSSYNPISSKCVSSTSVCTRVRDGHVEQRPGAAAAGALGSLNSSKKMDFYRVISQLLSVRSLHAGPSSNCSDLADSTSEEFRTSGLMERRRAF